MVESELNLVELFKQLSHNYENSFAIFDERKSKVENDLGNLKSQIKDKIDVKVELLKHQLEKFRHELLERVDTIIEKIILNEKKINEEGARVFDIKRTELTDYRKENNKLEISKFYEYQKILEEMLAQIRKNSTLSIELDFIPSNFEFKSSALGELKQPVFEQNNIISQASTLNSCEGTNLNTNLNAHSKNHWILCNSCKNMIKGIRYKCNECSRWYLTFDLCEQCKSHCEKEHSGHTFETIL